MRNRSPQALWETALGQLELHVTRPNYDTWLRHTVGLRVDDGGFVVGVPSDFCLEWLRTRLSGTIGRVLSQLLGATTEVSFQVEGAPVPASTVATNGQHPGPKPPRRPSLNARYTFETFTVLDSNRLAYRAARRLTTADTSRSPLVVFGAAGLGKSHLLQAIGHEALQAGYHVVAFTGEAFVDGYTKACRRDNVDAFRSQFDGCDVLLIDDLPFLATRPGSQEQFLHIFNALHDRSCRIAITTHDNPSTITGLSTQLRARLQTGLCAQVATPSADDRLALLSAKNARLESPLPDATLHLIAQHPYRSVSELEGALNRAAAYTELSHEPLSGDAIRRALQPFERRQAAPNDIVDAVCTYFKLSRDDLTGPSRARDITYARHLAIYLLRREGQRSLAEIGQLLGGRDHSTILSGYRRIDRERASRAETQADIDQLRAALLDESAA